MRVTSKKDSQLFDKLVTLANGDLQLVERAIKASVDASGTARLKNVVYYITKHQDDVREKISA